MGDSGDNIEERHDEMEFFGVRTSTVGFGALLVITFFIAMSSAASHDVVNAAALNPSTAPGSQLSVTLPAKSVVVLELQ